MVGNRNYLVYLRKLFVFAANTGLLNSFFEFIVAYSAILYEQIVYFCDEYVQSSHVNIHLFIVNIIELIENYLIEISQVGDFVPEAAHDVLIFRQFGWIAFAFAFDDAGTHSHAFEIVLVQEAIVVNVCCRKYQPRKIGQSNSITGTKQLHDFASEATLMRYHHQSSVSTQDICNMQIFC